MTYEQVRWLLDGLCQVEPDHGQRFYNELGTHFTGAVAGLLTPMLQKANSDMAETLAAMKKRVEEPAQKEAALSAREAALEGIAKQLHASMVEHATDVVLGRAIGKG